MMENLDKIPWEQVHHAYGPASDVPGQIRALLSTDANQRDDAFHELFGNIWHQGTVYEATTYALPFLIELLRRESVSERTTLALLVASILAGSGYHEVHSSIEMINPFTRKPVPKPADLDEKIRSERAVVAKVRELGRAALELLVPYLSDPEPEIRRAIAEALAKYPECRKDLLPPLVRAAAAETDNEVKAEMEKAVCVLQAW